MAAGVRRATVRGRLTRRHVVSALVLDADEGAIAHDTLDDISLGVHLLVAERKETAAHMRVTCGSQRWVDESTRAERNSGLLGSVHGAEVGTVHESLVRVCGGRHFDPVASE